MLDLHKTPSKIASNIFQQHLGENIVRCIAMDGKRKASGYTIAEVNQAQVPRVWFVVTKSQILVLPS